MSNNDRISEIANAEIPDTKESQSQTGKHRPTRKSGDTLFDLVDAMEQPLLAAVDLVRALEMVGLGLQSIRDDDVSRPVLAIAGELSLRLDEVKKVWRGMNGAARRQ